MQVLHQVKREDPNLIVGPASCDDAGVYKISDGTALVQTVDFFPPIVDDPATFGRIAAANALSDIYAMGATPRLALNIVCFPAELPVEVLNDIIAGAMEKLDEAGVLLVGGHTIEDKEVKFGLSLTGMVHPGKVITNSGAKKGDRLILTKAIGTGVVTSALKAGKFSLEEAADTIASMCELNAAASSAMTALGDAINACTDVTGFGLLGHAFEMADGSGVTLRIDSRAVPFLNGAKQLVKKKKNRPRNIKANGEFLCGKVKRGSAVNDATWDLLLDPQTSGGLLIAVEEDKSALLMEKIKESGSKALLIGEILEKECEIDIIVD